MYKLHKILAESRYIYKRPRLVLPEADYNNAFILQKNKNDALKTKRLVS